MTDTLVSQPGMTDVDVGPAEAAHTPAADQPNSDICQKHQQLSDAVIQIVKERLGETSTPAKLDVIAGLIREDIYTLLKRRSIDFNLKNPTASTPVICAILNLAASKIRNIASRRSLDYAHRDAHLIQGGDITRPETIKKFSTEALQYHSDALNARNDFFGAKLCLEELLARETDFQAALEIRFQIARCTIKTCNLEEALELYMAILNDLDEIEITVSKEALLAESMILSKLKALRISLYLQAQISENGGNTDNHNPRVEDELLEVCMVAFKDASISEKQREKTLTTMIEFGKNAVTKPEFLKLLTISELRLLANKLHSKRDLNGTVLVREELISRDLDPTDLAMNLKILAIDYESQGNLRAALEVTMRLVGHIGTPINLQLPIATEMIFIARHRMHRINIKMNPGSVVNPQAEIEFYEDAIRHPEGLTERNIATAHLYLVLAYERDGQISQALNILGILRTSGLELKLSKGEEMARDNALRRFAKRQRAKPAQTA